jgi:ATP-dependent Clp protease adaptor protein ClpS
MAGDVRKPGWEEGTDLDEKVRTKKPRLYKVLLHNDDYSTMEFVVWLLMKVFRRSHAEATAIMLSVHHKGVGVCGVYTREIAETKVAESTDLAREHGMPLLVTMEAE